MESLFFSSVSFFHGACITLTDYNQNKREEQEYLGIRKSASISVSQIQRSQEEYSCVKGKILDH